VMAGPNQEAVRCFTDAVKFRPKEPTYGFNLGIAYHRIGKRPAATAAYKRAHELAPENSDYTKAAEGY